jgi:hypothetical protein
VAIMTQWLNQALRELGSGLTPIARNGHVLVAGWTDRTPACCVRCSGARTARTPCGAAHA